MGVYTSFVMKIINNTFIIKFIIQIKLQLSVKLASDNYKKLELRVYGSQEIRKK